MPRSSSGRSGDEDAEESVVQRGRPAGDHAAKRAALLRAATSVIAQEGYAHASLRKVAQCAGCTTGAVTYYFANKEELVTALAEPLRHLRRPARIRPRGDDIKGLFDSWLAVSTEDPEFWPVMSQLLAHARYEPALADIIEQRYARYREANAKILADGQARGTVRDDIPAELLADQLAAMGDGWMMMFPFEPERLTPDRVRTLVDAALTLICPPSSPTTGA